VARWKRTISERKGSLANLNGKVERYLSLLRLPSLDVRIVPLLNEDSLEMTAGDRELVLKTVRGLLPEHSPIVITHGTDTMIQTGLHLHAALTDLSVPIVITGAMTPLGFEGSDGLQNLTESLLAVRMLPMVCSWSCTARCFR
jgi:L-asparaginase